MNDKDAKPLVPRPLASDDPEAWQAYWIDQGQPWRTEPEIDLQCQAYLRERLSISPNMRDGIYPFKDIKFKLERAHIEWVISYLEPIDWNDKKQRSKLGPNFCGADLRGLDLSKLPLTRACFGLTWNFWKKATLQQREQAAAHLEGANLWGANLEGSRWHSAHLEGAILAYARVQGAQFRGCHLDAADLHSIVVKGTDFKEATISDARGNGPRVADIEWMDTKLSQMPWGSVTVLGDEVYAKQLEREKVPHGELIEAYEQAVRAHEQLANTLQGKGMDASRFRYRGKVLQRQLLWKQRAWLSWFASMLLALTAGYGYRLGRIFVAYGLSLIFWALLYTVLGPPMSIWDALLVAGTGRGLPADASALAWVVQGCESAINNFVLGPLIVAMGLQRLMDK